jgi:hypothetical protein
MRANIKLVVKYLPRLLACRATLFVVLALSLAAHAHAASLPPRTRLPSVLASADTSLAPPLPPAAAPTTVRRPAASRLRELRGQRDFDYQDVSEEPAQASFWQRLVRWLWRLLHPALASKGGQLSWDILFYGLMAATLVFAVLKFLQVDLTKAFGRAARAQPLAYEAGQENIHELNFADAIAQAEAAGNLRLAVRLGYLQLLKQLTDRNLIAWQPDKTNQTYLRELAASQPSASAPFAERTRQFEYIWYGELPVPLTLYEQVRAGQRQLGQQLGAAGRHPHFA